MLDVLDWFRETGAPYSVHHIYLDTRFRKMSGEIDLDSGIESFLYHSRYNSSELINLQSALSPVF